MSISVQMKALSTLGDQIKNSSVDSGTKASLTQSVQQIKEELKAYEKDQWFWRIVVMALGIAIILVIVSVTVLLLNKINGFDTLTAIGTTALGGLVGLLAPSPVGKK